jgi:hypothetical protein
MAKTGSFACTRWLAAGGIALCIGCGGGSGTGGAGGGDVPRPYQPPGAGAPACELAADCPAGTHCDLGQCYQACNTALACAAASEACSNRGRCQAGEAGAGPRALAGKPTPHSDRYRRRWG